MPDPIQLHPRTRPTVPTREVPTDVGLLWATCTHPNRVRFATNLKPGDGESSLLINRVRYTCIVTLTRDDIPERQRSSYHRIDDTWHADSAILRRVGGRRGDATDSAERVLDQKVLPQLAAWLHTDEACDLLQQGDTHWRAECQRHADAAESALSAAFQTVQDLRHAVEAGRTLTRDEEQVLRHPNLIVEEQVRRHPNPQT